MLDAQDGMVFHKIPERKWEMTFTADGYCTWLYPDAPNVFHRFMQRWVLGIRWKRIEQN